MYIEGRRTDLQSTFRDGLMAPAICFVGTLLLISMCIYAAFDTGAIGPAIVMAIAIPGPLAGLGVWLSIKSYRAWVELRQFNARNPRQ